MDNFLNLFFKKNYCQRKVVRRLLKDMDMRNMIICHNLKKVYPGKNGNPDRHAVKGLSLALRKGQCFGMLGPNGAGKSSFINMVSNNSYHECFFFFFFRYCATIFRIDFHIAHGMHVQMIGLVKPTYGTAYIHGMDLRTDMDEIYTNIGVCPQHEYDHRRLLSVVMF
jgi:ABC-type cobalamin/Fe3+-siderophores transport system ATPase subunit